MVCCPDEYEKYDILLMFPFTSETKRMGIIVKARSSVCAANAPPSCSFSLFSSSLCSSSLSSASSPPSSSSLIMCVFLHYLGLHRAGSHPVLFEGRRVGHEASHRALRLAGGHSSSLTTHHSPLITHHSPLVLLHSFSFSSPFPLPPLWPLLASFAFLLAWRTSFTLSWLHISTPLRCAPTPTFCLCPYLDDLAYLILCVCIYLLHFVVHQPPTGGSG